MKPITGHFVKKKKGWIVVLVLLAITAGLMAASATPRSASPYYRLSTFAQVLSHIEQLYVEPVDQDQVIFGAIRGMLRELDPHSAFLLPDELKMLKADTEGQFGGVGMEVGVRDNRLTVITPMPDTPAERAGIQPGDLILAIEGKSTQTMSIEESVGIMRGKPGTTVTTTIYRKDRGEPFDVVLTREVIRVQSVKSELLAPGFPSIQVRFFQDGTAAEVEEAIGRHKAESGEVKGIVLDLRRNPGGVLDEAVRLSDLFIARDVIVTIRGKNEDILQRFEANQRGTMEEVALVVLIDGASASAAEIVAGALQDHGRALLVGTRSFGKGSVQSIINLDEGYGLKLTIARYFTPNGRSIQAQGVVPDVLIESRKEPDPDEETQALAASANENELPGHLEPENPNQAEPENPIIDDYQLRIAFQLVRGLANAQKAAQKPRDS